MRRLLIALATVSLLAMPSAATGQEQAPAVILIMDASGSMGRTDDAGTRLMDGAKEALTGLVQSLPEGTPIGLRVYGHRVPNTDKANGCLDTELVVPVGPLDRGQMTAAIDSFDSRGFTPIGLSLREAADDLGGFGTIVLVSDGEDTCAPPDPCDVAADLIAEGFNLRVQTVGFFLDDEPARQQLRCIAEATGGSFREVNQLPTLVTELGSIVAEAVPIEGNFHLPIIGGPTPEEATPVPWRQVDNEFMNLDGFFESPVPAGGTSWFSTMVDGGRSLLLGGAHLLGMDLVEGETLEIVILGPDGTDARRTGPRRGMAIVDLYEEGPAMFQGRSGMLGVGTATDFVPWSLLEPEERTVLSTQGIDEASYNELWLDIALARREPPIADGTYYIGLAWGSDRTGAELVMGWGGGITTAPADLYGQDYVALDGGLSRDEATELARAAEPWDRYGLPPPNKTGFEYPPYRWFYTATLQPGEARWFHQPLEFDEATEVEARVTTENAAGTLGVSLFDADLEPIGHDTAHPGQVDVPAATTAGVSMTYTGEGIVPAATARGAWLEVSWNSTSDAAVEVDLIVDVVERYPGITPPNPPPEPGPADPAPEPSEPISLAQPDEQPPTGRDETLQEVTRFVSVVFVLAVLVGGAWWWRRRRRA